jgi:transcriptional regulator
MYIPAHFANRDTEEIRKFIRANSFGILVSSANVLLATHIPLELSEDAGLLSGHLSKANPQAKALHDDQQVLCIFSGPHAYVSSSWYNHENVPTWNYIAVHVQGKIRLLEGDELFKRLSQIVNRYEAASENPVAVEGMSSDYVERHMRAIIGFDIRIDSMEAAYKLSQNRDTLNHANIMHELRKRGDSNSLAIAGEMSKRTPKS